MSLHTVNQSSVYIKSSYLLQYFSDACAHLLKGLRGELIFTEVLQDLRVETRGDMFETIY